MNKKERNQFYDSMTKELVKSFGDNNIAKLNVVIDNYKKENAELKKQLEIAKEALKFYASGWTMGFNEGELLVSVGTDLKFEEVHERARKALNELSGNSGELK